MQFEITQEFTFDCAHCLVDREGRPEYGRIHGHSFICEVTLSGARIAGEDWVVDFATFKAALADIAEQLDHRNLNHIDGLEISTMENICAWISERVSEWLRSQRARFPGLEIARVTLKRPTIGQTCAYHLNQEELR